MAVVLGCIPMSAFRVSAATLPVEAANVVTDSGTADTWEAMLGTSANGNRYAGRVWVDKSVYGNGQEVQLNTNEKFITQLENDEQFQVVFSALGSSMTTTTHSATNGPLDVVLVLDTSTSMDDEDEQGITRLQRTIESANKLLEDLCDIESTRIAIVTYNADSETVLPLAKYSNGIVLKCNNYYNNGGTDAGVIYAYDNSNQLLGKDSGYTRGTNLQSGIDRGFNILANATDVAGRAPVAIVLTDGEANRAEQDRFWDVSSYAQDLTGDSASGAPLILSTLLNAAYNKTKVEAHYGVEQKVYTVSVDLTDNTVANVLMNPGATSNRGFNASNNNIGNAYTRFVTWSGGQTVTTNNWTFNHDYPTLNGAITRQKIAANINYVDPESHFDVSAVNLDDAFTQITEELKSGAFNPIDTSETVDGATGVEDTPLIYVDYIGEFMEIKQIQAVTLFGNSYGVTKDASGAYKVTAATGTNPATGENWDTANDISISVSDVSYNGKTVQKLEIEINQEILPIMLDMVDANRVDGKVTSATLTEIPVGPLRVYYTVGLDSDIIDADGNIIPSALKNYSGFDSNSMQATFYSNYYSETDSTDASTGTRGDTHVGFQPSDENRYYYHQANQRIFSGVTKNGSAVTFEDNMYGVVYTDTANDTWVFDDITYEKYIAFNNKLNQTTPVDTQVYTYVTFFRPIDANNDGDFTNDGNAAEEVTYIVYTDWSLLKESVAFYDNNNKKYVGADGTEAEQGVVVSENDVNTYISSHPNAELYAVLGVGSLRTSRFHNMIVEKTPNATGTADLRYDPEYFHDTSANPQHHGNDVIVWLGNNGKVTVPIDIETGIALTKNVTEAIGNADDTYELTVTVPAGVTANPVVTFSDGTSVTATSSTDRAKYDNQVLTVNLKAGETAYITGIPEGTSCTIDETVGNDNTYKVSTKTDTVIVPTTAQVIAGTAPFVAAHVTNEPIKTGNLFITKEITSDHTVPTNLMDTTFAVSVEASGEAIKGNTYNVSDSANSITSIIFDATGKATLNIKAKQTIEILGLPAGTVISVSENLTTDQDEYFDISYHSRNNSGDAEDTDNNVTIQSGANATVVIENVYTPKSTTVDLDIVGTKNLETPANVTPTGSFTFKVEQYNQNSKTWAEIENKSATVEYNIVGSYASSNNIHTIGFKIEDVLNGIIFNKVGSYAFQVKEVVGTQEHITYDETLYTFTVTVTDNNGQLVATVTDLNNDPITNTAGDADTALDYNVVFNNKYDAVPVSIDVEKRVDNTANDSTISKAGFHFKAVETDATWTPLSPASELNVYSDAAGEARFTATYTSEGIHYFEITEINTGKTAWEYSTAKYHVTVTVAKDANNNDKLTATMQIAKVIENNGTDNSNETAVVNGNNGKIVFENKYDPNDATTNIDAVVKKSLTGKTLEADAFVFYVVEDGKAGTVLANPTANAAFIKSTGKNKAPDGNNVSDVVFVDFEDLTFSTVGLHKFDVIEYRPSEANAGNNYTHNGMTYDATVYDMVVEVRNKLENGVFTGSLEVAEVYFEDSTDSTVTFHNSYSVKPTQYQISGTKELTGRALKAGEFSFELYDASNNKIGDAVTNRTDGTFAFPAIEYTAAGEYLYTVKEVIPDDANKVPGVTYATESITVKVNVTDNGNGQLVAALDTNNPAIKFTNTYTPKSVDVKFNVNKTVVGSSNTTDTFTFKLYETDRTFAIPASAKETITNGAGTTEFEKIIYSTPGVHFYTIVEESDAAKEILYDTTKHNYAVSVTDDGSGQLKATLIYVNTGETVTNATGTLVEHTAAFTNILFSEITKKDVFKAGSTTSVDGQEVEAGETLTYKITYKNHHNAPVTVNIVDTIPAFTSYVDGSATENGTFDGTHLHWTFDVPADVSKTVEFNVTVDAVDEGGIISNYAVVRDGVNTYTTNEVKNTYFRHTVDVNLKKALTTTGDIQHTLGGFKFEIRRVEAVGKTLLGEAYSGNDGTITYPLTFDDEGTYEYEITEVNQGEKDMTYDATVHKLKIVLTKDTATGRLNATVYQNGTEMTGVDDKAEFVFNNTYSGTTPKPDNPEDPGKTVVVVPNTGDTTNTMLYVIVMAISGAALLGILFIRKRRLNNQEEA